MAKYVDKAELAAELRAYQETKQLSDTLYKMLSDMATGIAFKVATWPQAQALGFIADDAAHDVWLFLLPCLHKVDCDSEPFNYLTTMIFNHYRKWLRDRKNDPSQFSSGFGDGIRDSDVSDILTDADKVTTQYADDGYRYASAGKDTGLKMVRGQWSITYRGETKRLTQWARELNIHPATLRWRLLEAKWPIEKAMKPIKYIPRQAEIVIGDDHERPKSMKELCRLSGVSYSTACHRHRKGWSLLDAATKKPCKVLTATLAGRTQSVKKWCEEAGLGYDSVLRKIKKGFPPEEAIAGAIERKKPTPPTI